jgi:hypothetical protein
VGEIAKFKKYSDMSLLKILMESVGPVKTGYSLIDTVLPK